MKTWHYSGDANIENGGYFYNLDNWKWGYVEAVRVTPCSDAGAAENVFWVDTLTVNIREGHALESVVRTCGFDSVSDLPKGAARKHALVDCHIAYGAYDCDSRAVQVGKRQSDCGEPVRADIILRGNASIRRYAWTLCRGME